jgi:transposase InsO family protein
MVSAKWPPRSSCDAAMASSIRRQSPSESDVLALHGVIPVVDRAMNSARDVRLSPNSVVNLAMSANRGDWIEQAPIVIGRLPEVGAGMHRMFWLLARARVVISDWKADYNHRRRHSALGYQTLAVYAAARTHP